MTPNLIFWMLTRVYSSPALTQRLRDEVQSFAKASQPSPVFGIPEPARLEINDVGLVQSCPLLKACLHECLRLYSKATSMAIVQKDLSILESREDGRSVNGEGPQSFKLEAGDFAASLSDVHQPESCHYESSDSFQPDNFLVSSDSVREQQTLVRGALKPWGLGEFAYPGHVFAEQEVLAFVAAILVLWDLEPVNSQGWIVPRQKISAIISLPSADIRVRLRPRELSK